MTYIGIYEYQTTNIIGIAQRLWNGIQNKKVNTVLST